MLPVSGMLVSERVRKVHEPDGGFQGRAELGLSWQGPKLSGLRLEARADEAKAGDTGPPSSWYGILGGDANTTRYTSVRRRWRSSWRSRQSSC